MIEDNDSLETKKFISAPYLIYENLHNINSISWSHRKDKGCRLAVGTKMDQLQNRIVLIQFRENGEMFQDNNIKFAHPYPPTKLMFNPSNDTRNMDLIASSSEALRIWSIHENEVILQSVLTENHENPTILTAFDWNDLSPHRIASVHKDTLCNVWDLNRGSIDTSINLNNTIIHNIVWCGPNLLSTASADGSLHILDVRDHAVSNCLYKSTEPNTKISELKWNKSDTRFLAASIGPKSKIIVIDTRFPMNPIIELLHSPDAVITVAWDPNSSNYVCTGDSDSKIMLWDIFSPLPKMKNSYSLVPISSYPLPIEIIQLHWCTLYPELMAICSRKKIYLSHIL
eukprot:gnl/TRDRNA2_/TRDRNA2_177585_c2_seq1.p1 gnl/TRDRNA2_/TRDRNA2_177585_c2~~gnl/TRDRNA2_/TRDRNA2_177585_c2_seq1.p1  ORF type:complete len:342 (+),score=-30.67 gnl/TRDRNA2_/TRDRNA2_177585_c2_seq1:190-1215(+)